MGRILYVDIVADTALAASGPWTRDPAEQAQENFQSSM
jgi:hypothetical protein